MRSRFPKRVQVSGHREGCRERLRRTRNRLRKMNVLIVGAGKGLGLALARHYSRQGRLWMSFFTSRPEESLGTSFPLDLRDEIQILKTVEMLKSESVTLDLIFFVGAKTPGSSGSEAGAHFKAGLLPGVLTEYFAVNCIGPLLMFEHLYQAGLVNPTSKTIFFSSLAGSIEMRGKLPHNQRGGNLAYRLSKSALNSGVRNIAYDLSEEGPVIVCLHPGWVRTQSGGPNAETDIVFASERIVSFANALDHSDHGMFYHAEGGSIPW